MKKYLYILLAAGILTGCSQTESTEKTERATAENKNKTQEEDIHDHTDTAFKDTESLSPGIKKTYPLTQLKTETIDNTIQVKDNETVLYTEDTGHGIPTRPAGEGQKFHAILEVTFEKLKMYMIENGTFITADPVHVEVIETGHSKNKYPIFKMHKDDVKYLNSLDHKDPRYKAYVKYAEDYGQRQYDYKREMLMHTAIHQVNNETPNSLTIPEEPFLSFEQFKQKK
ncbi:hypothetical protein ERX37_08120 [Macrococcus hajekii]|uniref:Lipoprotein n=1 Tax=Macrococcus hajekii TaxID=198482 RepID=A0A4R6BIT9_9STAP|nr:membrane lipoprotein lipid attachment site-containing protein [Macrococcus hajekii]TDM01456.1 hypothetical protein ERX37_08120 [Macrococcus hajekii]GGB00140.1 hypothetical protein GCM10007190_05220 [Macrococcus hajekii]